MIQKYIYAKQELRIFMQNKRFQEILESRLVKIKDILEKKASEYASDDDRLANFKSSNKIEQLCFNQPINKFQTLFTKLTKQLDGVTTMIKTPTIATEYLINEKIGDVINYLILLEAMFIEFLESEQRKDIVNEI